MGLREKWGQLTPVQKKNVKRLLAATIGAVAGYTYYALVGCSTGHCPITSNPWISTGWGAMIGVTATL